MRRNLKVNENRLTVRGEEFEVKGGKVYLLSFGKAACPMARAVFDLLGARIAEGGVIVTKYATPGTAPKWKS